VREDFKKGGVHFYAAGLIDLFIPHRQQYLITACGRNPGGRCYRSRISVQKLSEGRWGLLQDIVIGTFGYLVDPLELIAPSVIAKLMIEIEQNHQKSRKANSQSGNVDDAMGFVF